MKEGSAGETVNMPTRISLQRTNSDLLFLRVVWSSWAWFCLPAGLVGRRGSKEVTKPAPEKETSTCSCMDAMHVNRHPVCVFRENNGWDTFRFKMNTTEAQADNSLDVAVSA